MTETMRRIGLGAAMLLLVAGCSSDGGAETTVAATDPAPTTSDAVATTVAPVATTAATVVAEGTSCVDCHTDEDTLKALAVEPLETESLSEGEG